MVSKNADSLSWGNKTGINFGAKALTLKCCPQTRKRERERDLRHEKKIFMSSHEEFNVF